MFCHECGKPNPEGARFCAFCGTRLLSQDAAGQDQPAQPDGETNSTPKPTPEPAHGVQEEKKAAKARPAHSGEGGQADPHQAFRRPADPEKLVRPLSDNPAQPAREGARGPRGAGASERKAGAPVTHKPVQSPAHTGGAAPSRPAQSAARRTTGRVGAGHAQGAPQHRAPQGEAVTSSGKYLTPPGRTPTVKKASRFMTPRRVRKDKQDDLFFDDINAEDDFYDDIEEENRLARRIKSLIALVFITAVLGVIIWLFMTGSGATFRASMGLGAPASAYKTLGDQAAEQGLYSQAAESYERALKLDSENYTYAYLVAQSQRLAGNRERANLAYQKCIQLRPNNAQLYRELSQLCQEMGNDQAAKDWLSYGYEQTGDASLLAQAAQTGQNEDANADANTDAGADANAQDSAP